MRKILLMSLSCIVLSGCASTPDPAKVCTSEWISGRSDKAVAEITKDTRGAVKSITKVASAYMDGKTPGMFQMWGLSKSMNSLEKELTRGSGIKDLKTVAKTCNNPKILTDGLSSFVQGMGLPPQMMNIMQNLPQYRNLIETHLKDLSQDYRQTP